MSNEQMINRITLAELLAHRDQLLEYLKWAKTPRAKSKAAFQALRRDAVRDALRARAALRRHRARQ